MHVSMVAIESAAENFPVVCNLNPTKCVMQYDGHAFNSRTWHVVVNGDKKLYM